MSYDEEQARKSRVVVETPNERREVVHSQAVRTPDRSGISAGMVGVLVVVAIALITMLVLFWMSSQPTTTDTASTAAQQPTTVVQQPAPAQQPPVIIQQPAPVTQPAPIVVTPPAGGTTSAPPSTTTDTQSSANVDTKIQNEIDKRLTDDSTFSTLGITATVLDAKVTLLGTVKTQELKDQVERMVRQIKGVKSVDNQITVL
ncbi:MAG TPA: BON domain-containing protein [Pyrinomonadaceae bacterium]|nr:BON domain-containing protein [Pyrinomonadaceae bacterium]